MKDPIREMIQKRKQGIHCAIPSFCTANRLVIEAIMEQAKRFDDYVLIEATANQVNQYGGYTNMKPADFREEVLQIAKRIGFSEEKVLFGGDHLGPLLWAGEPEEEAMGKAEELVRLFVAAGYKKIHLDTSMKLGSDAKEEPLSDEAIARRGARLYRACEEEYQKLAKRNPQEMRPVYIIGSEVPIPGGAQEEEAVEATSPDAVEATVEAYRKEFAAAGCEDAFENIIALVVQPGVEFGDDSICHYDRSKAAELCGRLKEYDGLIYEGHSTDYQSPKELRQMAEDGIAILKVGPALTFALREALFALSMIEKELVEKGRADFMEALEACMKEEPKYWQKHYHGSDKELAVKRRYSFSDRCRYYLTRPEVEEAIERLFVNLSQTDIPLSMLAQYMPAQYAKIRDGKLGCSPKEMVKDHIVSLVDHYNYAVKNNYIIGEIL